MIELVRGYAETYNKLDKQYRSIAIHEFEEDIEYDRSRLQYIVAANNFLIQYHTKDKRFISGTVTLLEESFTLQICRYLLTNIMTITTHLSQKIKEQCLADTNLSPHIWNTFERLGGLMIPHQGKMIFVPFPANQIENDFAKCFSNIKSEHLRQLNLHAALRKLQKIGELITNNNIFTICKAAAPEFPWQDFKTIRNDITHQEYVEYQTIVSDLMREPQRLQTIFNQDLPNLQSRIVQIIKYRDQHSLHYYDNENYAEDFWAELHANKALDQGDNGELVPVKENTENTAPNITELANLFKKSREKHMLTNRQRLNSAISSLQNIQKILTEDSRIRATFNQNTFAAWVKRTPKNFLGKLYQLLLTNHILADAIEYNAGQFLSHINHLIKPESSKFKELHKWHENSELSKRCLRVLRNYIEHGNYLFDYREQANEEAHHEIPERIKIVINAVIINIIELLPVLLTEQETIKQSVTNNVNSPKFFSQPDQRPQKNTINPIDQVTLQHNNQ